MNKTGVKGLEKRVSGLIILLLVCSLFGCQKQTHGQNEAGKHDASLPYLQADDQVAQTGKEITVAVHIGNYEPLMTMAVNIDYDPAVMELIEVKNGSDFQDYSFVKPKNLISGCRASWFIPEIEETEKNDVELLVLKFQIAPNAPKGNSVIRFSCPNDGGIVDENQSPVTIQEGTAVVAVQ